MNSSMTTGNELPAHRTAKELNNPDGQDQRCNAIELGVAIRQHSERHENTAKYGADDSLCRALARDAGVRLQDDDDGECHPVATLDSHGF